MKNLSSLLILVFYLIIFLLIVLPFTPGRYDGVVASISTTVQLFFAFGMPAIIPALFWLFHLNLFKKKAKVPGSERAKFPLIYLALTSLFYILGILTVFLAISISLGLIMVLFFTIAFISIFNLHKNDWRNISVNSGLPLNLIGLPVFVLFIQLILAKPLTDRSRNKAIANSKQMKSAIDSFYTINKSYPASLNAVWHDYQTGIRGIHPYIYVYDHAHYNIYFEQFRFLFDIFGTREFVVYNPADKHLILSHNSWFLTLPDATFRANQGWYRSINTDHSHWKSFLFD